MEKHFAGPIFATDGFLQLFSCTFRLEKGISVKMNSITFLLTGFQEYYNAKISFFIWERQRSATFNKEKFISLELTNGLSRKQNYLVKAASRSLCTMCSYSELPAHLSFKKKWTCQIEWELCGIFLTNLNPFLLLALKKTGWKQPMNAIFTREHKDPTNCLNETLCCICCLCY